MPKQLEGLPQPIKQAMLHALIRAGAKLPSEDAPMDESTPFMLEAVSQGQATSLEELLEKLGKNRPERRMATAKEAAILVKHAGPCRFKPGDRIKWHPDMWHEAFDFPKKNEVAVVTQVIEPPIRSGDTNNNQSAVRNDIAVAYVSEEDGQDVLLEFVYDSRRFIHAMDPIDGVSRIK